MFFIYSRKSRWHSWYEFTRNQDPFDYLIKTTVFPSTHAITSTQTLSPNLYTPLVPLESRQEDRRFRWCGILQSGVGRIDNGRPILKVTLYVAENPEPGSHTISSIHLGEGLRSVCTPRVSSPLPLPLYGEETRRIPLWCSWPFQKAFRVDEDGHSDKRIPRRRNPRFETAISRSIGDRSRLVLEETEDHGKRGEREVQGWQALDRMEIRRNNGSTSFLPSYRQ